MYTPRSRENRPVGYLIAFVGDRSGHAVALSSRRYFVFISARFAVCWLILTPGALESDRLW
jgi:hypothetical protein